MEKMEVRAAGPNHIEVYIHEVGRCYYGPTEEFIRVAAMRHAVRMKREGQGHGS